MSRRMKYETIVKILDALYREQTMYVGKARETEDYFDLLDEIAKYEELRDKVTPAYA